MKVIYYADDGTEFETEDECLRYEEIHNEKIKRLLSEIHAFTERKKKIKVIDGPYDIENMIADTYYVIFDSREAWNFFNQQQEDYGYAAIKYSAVYRNGDVFLYQDTADSWVSAKTCIKYYQGILDKFTERK